MDNKRVFGLIIIYILTCFIATNNVLNYETPCIALLTQTNMAPTMITINLSSNFYFVLIKHGIVFLTIPNTK